MSTSALNWTTNSIAHTEHETWRYKYSQVDSDF